MNKEPVRLAATRLLFSVSFAQYQCDQFDATSLFPIAFVFHVHCFFVFLWCVYGSVGSSHPVQIMVTFWHLQAVVRGSISELLVALVQPVGDRNALIENKAFTFP